MARRGELGEEEKRSVAERSRGIPEMAATRVYAPRAASLERRLRSQSCRLIDA